MGLCDARGEAERFTPIIARTRSIRAPIGPIAYDCVKLIFVRHGSAVLLSEFGEQPVNVGDVILLGANVLCGSEPEGDITVTTLYLDRDYVVDQFFWQHASAVADRLEAADLIAETYAEPAQVLHVGEDRAGMLLPWLDELVALSVHGAPPERFYRTQALLFIVLDVILPYVVTSSVRRTSSQRRTTVPAVPRQRQFIPLRTEARAAVELLRSALARRWTLSDLADAVHLSPSQLGRVFVDTYGKTPMTYLATLRAERLARLLRETDLPIEAAMHHVGWHSRGHAARVFRQCVGVTPTRYRQLRKQRTAA